MTLAEHRPSFLGAGWPWPRDGIRPLSRSAVPSASAPRSAGDPQGWKKFPPADAGRADIARKPRVGAAAHLPEFRAADSAAADPVLTQRAGAPVLVPQPAIGNPTGKACRQHPNANRNLDPHLKSNRFEGFVDAGGTRLLELAQNGQARAWRIAQQAMVPVSRDAVGFASAGSILMGTWRIEQPCGRTSARLRRALEVELDVAPSLWSTPA